MIPFSRRGEDLVAHVDGFEAALMISLVGQVAELLGGRAPRAQSSDPFAQWESEFEPGVELDRSDPVIARLFPDAYEDAGAAGEHHRFSQEALRRDRIADSDAVLAVLGDVGEDGGELVVPADAAEAWLRVFNGVRLSLAVRLGIETDTDHADLEALSTRDPRSQIVDLYDWLGLVLESLLDALHRDA